MRKGETAMAAAASWTTEGISGSISSVPQILTYQSQIAINTVINPNKDSDDDED